MGLTIPLMKKPIAFLFNVDQRGNLCCRIRPEPLGSGGVEVFVCFQVQDFTLFIPEISNIDKGIIP